ncbi:MAG: sensor histidine kinase [Rhodobacteraceae bacterium]|nr:sensor histidine kinase [Paracoccaceae bacterium]
MSLAERIGRGGTGAKPDPVVGAKRAPGPKRDADVLLGEDWVGPQLDSDAELRLRRLRRGVLTINRSPLARKIITFNLLAMIILVAGMLYLNPFRDTLVDQREAALRVQAGLVANLLTVQMPLGAPVNLASGDGLDVGVALDRLNLPPGGAVFVYDAAGQLVAQRAALMPTPDDADGQSTVLTDFLNMIWGGLTAALGGGNAPAVMDGNADIAGALVPKAIGGSMESALHTDAAGRSVFAVAAPLRQGGRVVGAVGITSAAGEIEGLVRHEREQMLQMFVIALLVSVGLSMVLASTIANPLSDLAAAAELGRDRSSRQMSPGRVRIPDLTARPDEIGRLSVAMRGMVTALYDRIEANEHFAADVSHEIKNPLASLRSAVGTLRVAKRDDQREKLLDVIDHDVRRLDRLVSDISNASRLDSELVKEEEEVFDLTRMLSRLTEHLGREAREKGIDFISDLPKQPVRINGLEGRLAQVFVNLITNALSFCEKGDAVRVWARHRENRVLVVVEDTGPGIPEAALTKVFKRFYSERPVAQFGNHSGLGLAISKQIVEAHGGVIWAENIRPTDADITSDPLGARFVVGLPV